MRSSIQQSRWQRLTAAFASMLVAALLAAPAALSASSSVPLVTENSASQNGLTVSSANKSYGPLDPWAYRLVHGGQPSLPQTTGHVIRQSAPQPTPIAGTGFRWRDAGVGAGGTAAAVLLMVAAFVARRRRTLTHAQA